MLNITTGKINRPQKVVIYGPEGIGKTTLASQFPDPLFIDTEGSTTHLDVKRASPADWAELLDDVREVAATPNICKTLVIDTADWAEQMATKHIVQNAASQNDKIKGIEDFGYSKGYTYLSEEFEKLIHELDKVISAGMNVVVVAHAQMRKFEQPDEMGSYDRWEMKLTKRVCPLLKEWCDLLLFCNYKTYVVQSSNTMEKAKAQGGSRVMYTSHHACWDAKNRHDLPDELPLSYEGIAKLFSPETPLEQVKKMAAEAGITSEDIQRVAVMKGKQSAETPLEEYPDTFLTGWVIRYWNNILNIIKEDKNND